ncbi:MAG: N-6 DNA methylase [Solirubrobacterales bacterium]
MTDAAAIRAPGRRKQLGAFYTPPAMAAVLTEWAVRSRADRVLDPSFGGLVFLAAARERLRHLGAYEDAIARQLYGVDLDEDAHEAARAGVERGIRKQHLLDRDFFAVDPSERPLFEAVIGNPPYIRYQNFNGSAAKARALAAEAGVKLTRLASSWAPFVIHGSSFVAPGGRLAQVLPAELLHAQYASEVIEFLRRAFGRICIVVFEERVFPGALEEVVLLCADGRGAAGLADVRLVSCQTVTDVEAGLAGAATASEGDAQRPMGSGKLLAQLLPRDTQLLYERLAAHDDVTRLGEAASVDIGIVTGANEFFVLSQGGAERLHPGLLRPAVCKATHVAGARLTLEDHRGLLRSGQRSLMFVADDRTPDAVLHSALGHVEQGRRDRLDERYKCRIRDPWWALPIPKQGAPDLLLTYCSNEHPRLAVNEAGALNTNTLHGVRPVDKRDSQILAVGFYNSLTLLSGELVGRSYGGGVLKLEPTEAEALLLPSMPPELGALMPHVDRAVRARDVDAAVDLVDPIVLGALGLSTEEVRRLRSGWGWLQERRTRRGRPAR